MIEFVCPTCKTFFRAEDTQSGKKMNCSNCGQRLMIPPPRYKTILGEQVVSKPSTIPSALGGSDPKIQPPGIIPIESTYHYMNQGECKGPVDFARLRRLVETKQLEPEDMVWSQANNAWVPAKLIEGLFTVQPNVKSLPQETSVGVKSKASSLRLVFEKLTYGRSRGWWMTTALVGGGFVVIVIVMAVLTSDRLTLNSPTTNAEKKPDRKELAEDSKQIASLSKEEPSDDLTILIKQEIDEARKRSKQTTEELVKLALPPETNLGFEKAINIKLQDDLQELQRLLDVEKALRATEKNVGGSKAKTLKQMFADIAPSIPIVYALDELGFRCTGTGFVIRNGDRLLVGTNRHVVKGASKGVDLLFLKRKLGSDYDQLKVHVNISNIVAIHKSADMALLDVTTKKKEIEAFQNYPFAPLAKPEYEYAEGEEIFIIGHPGSGSGGVLKHSLSAGIVSGVGRTDPVIPGKYLQLTAPVNPGNSGGPVFDNQGKIIGVSTYIIRWSQDKKVPLEGLNFALEISHVHELVDSEDYGFSATEIQEFVSEQKKNGKDDKLLALSQIVFDQFAKTGFHPYTGNRKSSAIPFVMPPNGDYFQNITNNRNFAKIVVGVISEGSGDIGISVMGPSGSPIVSHSGLVPDPVVAFSGLKGTYSVGVHNFRNSKATCVLLLLHDSR